MPVSDAGNYTVWTQMPGFKARYGWTPGGQLPDAINNWHLQKILTSPSSASSTGKHNRVNIHCPCKRAVLSFSRVHSGTMYPEACRLVNSHISAVWVPKREGRIGPQDVLARFLLAEREHGKQVTRSPGTRLLRNTQEHFPAGLWTTSSKETISELKQFSPYSRHPKRQTSEVYIEKREWYILECTPSSSRTIVFLIL